MLNLTSLRTFVAVVETGGIRSAGERLLRTPSAVSMSLKQLEEEVGGALFQGERKNELSELGRLVFEEARGLLSHHARTSAAIMAFATDRVGRCDLASVPSVAVTLLTETIAEVRRRGFSFDIHVRDIDSTAIIDAVENGAIEVGLCVIRNKRPGLRFDPLFREPLDFVCLADHPLALQGVPVEWGEISRGPMIGNGSFASLALPEVAQILADAHIFAHNVSSNLAMVAAGIGATVLPRMCRWKCDPYIRFLPIADTRASRTVGLLTKEKRSLQPATNILLDQLRQLVVSRVDTFGYEIVT